MKIENIRTRDDFIALLSEKYKLSLQYAAELADQYVAIQQARLVFEQMDVDDLAGLFMDGITGIKEDPEKAHQEYWESIFSDYDETGDQELLNDAVYTITNDLQMYFGDC